MNRSVLGAAQAISAVCGDSFGHSPNFYYCPKQREPGGRRCRKVSQSQSRDCKREHARYAVLADHTVSLHLVNSPTVHPLKLLSLDGSSELDWFSPASMAEISDTGRLISGAPSTNDSDSLSASARSMTRYSSLTAGITCATAPLDEYCMSPFRIHVCKALSPAWAVGSRSGSGVGITSAFDEPVRAIIVSSVKPRHSNTSGCWSPDMDTFHLKRVTPLASVLW